MSHLAMAPVTAMPGSFPSLSDRELRTLLETTPYAWLVVSAGGEVRFTNAAARSLLGLEAERRGQLLAAAGAAGAALFGLTEEHAAEWRARPQWVRLTPGALGPCRVLVAGLGAGGCALLVRRLASAENAARHALVRLGLDPGAARLAAQAYAGWSNAAIARALGLALGTVKSRLNRIFHQLGIRRRAGLALLVDAALGEAGDLPGPAGVSLAPRVERTAPPPPREETAVIASLRTLLDRVHVGVAAFDAGAQAVFMNPEAQRLLRGPGKPGGAAAPAPLARIGAEVAAGEPPPRRALRLDGPTGALRAVVWLARPGLAGAWIQRERVPEAEIAVELRARFGLSAHQAQVAVLIARGQSNVEIAVSLGVHAGSVRSERAVIYAKLGVSDVIGLATLVADLGLDDGR